MARSSYKILGKLESKEILGITYHSLCHSAHLRPVGVVEEEYNGAGGERRTHRSYCHPQILLVLQTGHFYTEFYAGYTDLNG